MPTEREVIRALLAEKPKMASLLRNMIASGKMGSTDDVSPDEPMTIIVGPYHGGVIGAVRVTCACGGYGWLSPSTQEVMKSRSHTTIICYECMMKMVRPILGSL